MLKQNTFFVAARALFVDALGDVLYFPIWWYSSGLKNVAINRYHSISGMANQLALRLLVLNIFKPMFAQYDRAGRVISFFARILILIARSIYFVIYTVLQILLLVLWLVVPLVVVFRIFSLYVYPYV
jgi:hypothetical protein